MPHQLNRLRGRHKMIIRMHEAGMKNRDIAAELNVSEQMVSYTLNGNLGLNGIAEAMQQRDAEVGELAGRIKSMTVEALDVIDDLLVDPAVSPTVKWKAATDILDRGGFAAERNVNIRGAIAHITPQDIDEMKRRVEAERDARKALPAADFAVTLPKPIEAVFTEVQSNESD